MRDTDRAYHRRLLQVRGTLEIDVSVLDVEGLRESFRIRQDQCFIIYKNFKSSKWFHF